MDVVFSGTREGMTKAQKDTLIERFHEIMEPYGLANIQAFHHGVSGLSDEFAHAVARACHFWVIGHPCNIEKYRFDCICDELRLMKDPLDRNQDMIDEVMDGAVRRGEGGLLIAAPLKDRFSRSGTYSTVAKAGVAGLPYEIIQRNGVIRYEI